jgi:transposase-like protein
MRAKFYSDEFKAEAIRLVVQQRLSAAEAGARLNIRSETVLTWVRRFRHSRSQLYEVDRLKTRLNEIAIERDVLIELATRLLDKTGQPGTRHSRTNESLINHMSRSG